MSTRAARFSSLLLLWPALALAQSPKAATYITDVTRTRPASSGPTASWRSSGAGSVTIVDGAAAETDAWDVHGHRPVMISGVVAARAAGRLPVRPPPPPPGRGAAAQGPPRRRAIAST